MRPAGPRRRSRRVLIIITLLAITLVTIDATGGGAFDPVRNLASDVMSPISGAVGWVTSPVRNLWNSTTGYGELEEENQRLRDELDELRASEITESNYREQLERLTAQLDIGFTGEIPTEVARVSGGPRNNFEDHRLEIDKGSNSGLEVGMPVVTKGGLVGRLERVASNRSIVQLATDPSFVIGVRLATTQDIGTGHGTGPEGPFVIDNGIEIGDEVKPGEFVVTSGLSRSILPPDIPIGQVTEVIPDEANRSLILRVDWAAEFSQLDVVQVMKWVPPS